MAMCAGDPSLFDLSNNRTVAILEALWTFNNNYTLVHRYICAAVCSLGVLLNSLHIIVLTRRPMRAFAINNILSCVAICDVITMLSYLIYIFRFKIFEDDDEIYGYSYSWLLFLMCHVIVSIALHTVSIYLCVVMAFVRWNALDRLDSRWVKTRSVGRVFMATFTAVAVLSIPTFMVHKIVPMDEVLARYHRANRAKPHSLLYTITMDDRALRDGCALLKGNLWLTGICFKVIPCALLFGFTVALMRKLCEMSKKRRLLLASTDDEATIDTLAKKLNHRRRKAKGVDKTTVMLIIMLTVFLCTELPQGALAILNAIYTTHVHEFVYINLGELLDLLSLVNCNVGFVLYCAMSSRYRITFRRLFLNSLASGSSKPAAAAANGFGALNTNTNNNRRHSITNAVCSVKNNLFE